MSRFSDQISERVREVRSLLAIDPRRFEAVAANLAFLYDAVVASEQLLIEGVQSTESLPATEFHVRLGAYYRSHLEEERDHARWLREDLESAGIRLGAPDRTATAMVGTQYYLIKHVHPSALLGYMAVVEGDPVPLREVECLERIYGKNLLRFVRFHAIKDIEHREELFEVIDFVPESLQGVISNSAENVLFHLREAVSTWQ